MTSILDEIKAFFSWNPPALKPVTLTGKKSLTKSCSPTFYDKHFFDPLVLKCVKCLPSLVQDLITNVDCALWAASETLPPVDGFYAIQKGLLCSTIQAEAPGMNCRSKIATSRVSISTFSLKLCTIITCQKVWFPLSVDV